MRLTSSIFAVAIVAGAGPHAVCAQPPSPTLVEWGAPRATASAVPPGSFAWQPAPGNGNTATALFDSLGVNLQGPDAPLAASRVVTLDVPVRFLGRGTLTVTHDLRVHVTKPARARAVVILAAAGRTTVLDFAPGAAMSRDTVRRVAVGVAPGAASHAWTIVVLAERSGLRDAVLVTVDSDDLKVRRAR